MSLRGTIPQVTSRILVFIKKIFLTHRGIGIAALLFLVSSLFLTWVDVPLGHNVKSYNLSLFSQSLPLDPHVFFLSFGTIIGILCSLGAYAVFKNKARVMLIVGFVACFLGLLIVCKMVLSNPSMTEDIRLQNIQVLQMMGFSQYMPPNRAIDPTLIRDMFTYTAAERLTLAWHVLTWGWYCLLISSALFIVSAYRGSPDRRSIKVALGTISGIVLILLFIISPPAIAEYYKYRGDSFLSGQRFQSAHDAYRTALKLNPDLMKNEIFAWRYGETQYNLGTTASPFSLLYWGREQYTQKRFTEAVMLFTRAHELSPGNSVVAHSLSSALIEQGLNYFRKKSYAAAVRMWERSFQVCPAQIETLYYLSLGYKYIGMYEAIILAGQQFADRSANGSLNANVYANMGDARSLQRDFPGARALYEKSRSTDFFLNYRAGYALGGI